MRSASSAKSTIVMAFVFTMPMNKKTPIGAMMVKSTPTASRARRAPTQAEGRLQCVLEGPRHILESAVYGGRNRHADLEHGRFGHLDGIAERFSRGQI